MLPLGGGLDGAEEGILLHAIFKVLLAEVSREDYGLICEQRYRGQQLGLLTVALNAPGGLPALQGLPHPQEKVQLCLVFFIRLQQLPGLVNAPVQHLYIGEYQFKVDGLYVPERVYAPLHVDYVPVLKAAHHVHHRVNLPDIGEELVPKALSL